MAMLDQFCIEPMHRNKPNISYLAKFARSTEFWNFPWWAWTRSKRWWLILGNVRKSHYGLKFGVMMQCTMKWITLWNGHAQPMLAFSVSWLSWCYRSLEVLLYLAMIIKFKLEFLWNHQKSWFAEIVEPKKATVRLTSFYWSCKF